MESHHEVCTNSIKAVLELIFDSNYLSLNGDTIDASYMEPRLNWFGFSKRRLYAEIDAISFL